MQRYCFFLICANIFEKKMLFSGKKRCFLCFFGVAVMGLEGIETIETIVWHFFFLQAGAQASPKGHCFFAAFSFVSLPSFCRPFAVFLPSFCRLFAVFVSRLKATGIGQGITRKIIGIAM